MDTENAFLFPDAPRTPQMRGTANPPPIAASDASAPPRRVLVTGASGQIGAEFVLHLRQLFGHDSVVRLGRYCHVISTHFEPSFLE